jgi:molybdenum cofactor cytidylyltransferase
MIFGPAPLSDASGAILAHSRRVGERMLRKGSVLDAAAIDALRADGVTEIICARLEPGDIPEDAAADRLAEPLLGPGIRRTRATTGRVNLIAEIPGLLRVNAARIDRLNTLDESLTLGTLPDYAVVAPKDLLATIKIIPFAVSGPILETAEALVRDGASPLTLHPFRPLKVGLVVSRLPGLKDSVVSKSIEITGRRVTALTGTLLPAVVCPHQEAAIAEGLQRLITAGADLLLVIGASAVVDRRDIGPAGIVRAGGEIRHFGMPVDPGNLICLGRIGDRPALVLPGCARSPNLNGIDFVLSRLFAGIPVTGADVMHMGVGGLLKDMETRPLPTHLEPRPSPDDPEPRPLTDGQKPRPLTDDKSHRPADKPRTAPRKTAAIAAIVLAAGRSSRMAPHNKLLIADKAGKPMIARVVDNVLSSGARPILVVTGHMRDAVEEALGGRPVTMLHAPDYAEGLAASLKTGIAAVPPECAGAIVCLGDMPLVTGRMIDRVLSMHDADEGRLIVQPTYQGKPGNPMLWDRRFFDEIMQLSGDTGARLLVRQHADSACEIEIGDDAILRDFDTPESLATLPRHMRSEEVE